MSWSPFKNIRDEIRLIKRRSWIAIGIIVLLMLVIILRLSYLTLFKHDYYQNLAIQNQIHRVPIVPSRGLIYDSNGTLLAKNISVYTLEVTPSKSKNLQQTLLRLQALLNLSNDDIAHFFKERNWYHRFDSIPLKIHLTDKQVALFSSHRFEFPSASIKATLIRQYPYPYLTAYPIGYVGRINSNDLKNVDKDNYAETQYIGKTGLEAFYENVLHGKVGYHNDLVDAQGKVIRELKETPPKAGQDLDLSLDLNVQRAGYKAFKGETGAAVAIDPNNGKVLAMISTPSFDPNLFVKGITPAQYQSLQQEKALYNRAIRGIYPLASTIKPFMALQGLMIGAITADFTLFDPGYFMLPGSNHVFHDWVKGGHGTLNVVKAIEVSCDTFFYNLANKMGIEKMDQILRAFGFGKPANIDLPNQLTGTVPSPAWKEVNIGKPWYPGDTIVTGIGQGYVTTTPLQLADAVATLSMHGQRYQPSLLQNTPAAPLPSVKIDDATWNTVIEGMTDVIKAPQGTGFRFGRNAPYTVAAKTGTAQVITRTQRTKFDGDVPKKYHNDSLFIAFAPIDNPKIAVAVVVEHAERAPIVARKMMDALLLKSPH